jgi:phage/plasmid-like protein (TIGR03299 family)
MSDRIQGNQLAYAGDTPWHGKGINIDDLVSQLKQGVLTQEQFNAKLLEAASLDWTVQRRAIAMRQADGTGLVVDPLAGYRAIVRSDTDQVFQIATERYHPLQNAEVVDFFRAYCEAGHATMETLGAIDGGSKIFALAKLNGGSSTSIKGDDLRGYMLLATSHDGSLQIVGKATQVRVVCWNTLSAALGLTGGRLGKKEAREFRMKHTRKWTPAIASEAQKVMGMAVEQIQRANEIASQLSHCNIDEQGRIEYVRRLLDGQGLLEQVVSNTEPLPTTGLLDSVIDTHMLASSEDPEKDLGRLGKHILEAIMTSPGSDLESANNTLWGAVNGVTYHVDHERGRSQDTRLSAAWFGPGDKLKTQAVQVAVDMAGISVTR